MRRPSRIDCRRRSPRRAARREHRLQHRGARRAEQVAAETVQRGDDVEQPDVALVVHEEEQAHDARERDWSRSSAALVDAVDDEAADAARAGSRGRTRKTRGRPGVRPVSTFAQIAEDDEHHPVAEHRERLACEEQADVAACEQRAHWLRAEDAEVAADRLAAHDERGAAVVRIAPGSLPSGTSETARPRRSRRRRRGAFPARRRARCRPRRSARSRPFA